MNTSRSSSACGSTSSPVRSVSTRAREPGGSGHALEQAAHRGDHDARLACREARERFEPLRRDRWVRRGRRRKAACRARERPASRRARGSTRRRRAPPRTPRRAPRRTAAARPSGAAATKRRRRAPTPRARARATRGMRPASSARPQPSRTSASNSRSSGLRSPYRARDSASSSRRKTSVVVIRVPNAESRRGTSRGGCGSVRTPRLRAARHANSGPDREQGARHRQGRRSGRWRAASRERSAGPITQGSRLPAGAAVQVPEPFFEGSSRGT